MTALEIKAALLASLPTYSSEGCHGLDAAVVAQDIGEPKPRVARALRALLKQGRVLRCGTSSWALWSIPAEG